MKELRHPIKDSVADRDHAFFPVDLRWHRHSRTRLMAVGVGAWSIATAATAVMRSFGQLLMARSCVGVGEAAYSTISPALLSDYFPLSQRGRAFAVFYVAIPVGAAVGFLLGGAIGRAYGWRAAFYAVGLPGVAMRSRH
jgi:MFS family permease